MCLIFIQQVPNSSDKWGLRSPADTKYKISNTLKNTSSNANNNTKIQVGWVLISLFHLWYIMQTGLKEEDKLSRMSVETQRPIHSNRVNRGRNEFAKARKMHKLQKKPGLEKFGPGYFWVEKFCSKIFASIFFLNWNIWGRLFFQTGLKKEKLSRVCLGNSVKQGQKKRQNCHGCVCVCGGRRFIHSKRVKRRKNCHGMCVGGRRRMLIFIASNSLLFLSGDPTI